MKDFGKAAAVGVCVFFLSLPVMYAIRNFAVFAFGLGVWVVPWWLGAILWPQGALGGLIQSEFDGAAYGFVLFGSIQNAVVGAVITYSAIVASRYVDKATSDPEPTTKS